MNQDKRKLKRRHLIYYLHVKDRATDKTLGYLVDITTRGILIMSEAPLEVQQTYHLKLLVQTDGDTAKYLNFDAQSKWCVSSVNTDFYDTGLELLNLTAEDFGEIEKIIYELGFKD
ncbi:MAG: hypothetical protein WCQ99_09555 [Pseudomonadota bacterium]